MFTKYGMLGGGELLLVLLIVIVVIGPRRIWRFFGRVRDLMDKARSRMAKAGRGLRRLGGGFSALREHVERRREEDG